ncbi:uncharacterized protein LOC128550943 isoform X2 [Mercenaria mercenaria]|uniref:uncharacterized protein LOC128550943 isoform X2 n=1 Tax=Mercenaria mercenaria TaxID=6596 RepID=UPI00234F64C0|nr:uncharacterized protein LOC128550943 isoform X2 [Mercenaria mercenaria]
MCRTDFLIWTVLIVAIYVPLEASDNVHDGQVRVQVYDEATDMRIQTIRSKRFLDGTCTFSTFNKLCRFTCKELKKFYVCFTAKLNYLALIPETADVEIEGTVDGLKLFAERIGRSSDPNPPPKCSTSSVFSACMVLKDVNPPELSACIELFNKTSNTTYQMGCFSTSLFGATTLKVTSLADSTQTSTRRESENTGTSQSSTSGSTNVTIVTTIKPNGEDVNGSQRIGTIPHLLLISLAVLNILTN